MTNEQAAELLRLLKLFSNREDIDSRITQAIEMGATALTEIERCSVTEFFMVFRGTSPMTWSRDALYFAGLHPRSQAGPTIFLSRKKAREAIKLTNAVDKRDRLGWTEAFGKLWILRCKVEGGAA